MASNNKTRKKIEAPRSLQKSYLGEQNILALEMEFQYIVTLANCNTASVKKSSAHHNFRWGLFSALFVRSQNRFLAGLSGGPGPLVHPNSLA